MVSFCRAAVVICLLSLTCHASAAVAEGRALGVEFVPITPTLQNSGFAMTGTIEAKDNMSLGFRLGGRVAEVMVSEGDQVSAGDPLARTDPLQQDQALQVATAALTSAQAAQEQTAAASSRADAMLARGVGTRAAADQARQALSQATGAVERASTAVEQARRAVEDTVLRAPADGVVTLRAAEAGQIVGAAQPVIGLSSLTSFEAVFQVPDAPHLNDSVGLPVTLDLIDVDLPQLTGQVAEISPLVNPVTGAVEMRVRIDGAPADADLLGTAVYGSMTYSDGAGISIPWTALARHGRGPAVWVVGDDGRVAMRPITIARFLNSAIIVAEGLSAGETVVGAGSQMMYPGRPVIDAGRGRP
ncbi:MAG: efflux RND transporter periplasmic adaptor subunit [Paracoccus sp. (in: a-proteobacteria)]|uniref:efflux RND transporter periplasmic adaptor subunit n=1 Tax=Paracoccus sp. TaxID=267 RepID=UPI0026E02923|nr:efflux RND transporter periplasmic adaptor subunit [Paracoccus sp. (in: a-proteobacteria)]MDO5613322.1 efflux RND transporter periplasmic adaptor subunit [Paracoccus sp. (in: a-proteobacteria)]